MSLVRRLRAHWQPLLFFAVLFLAGYVGRTHYGVSADEPTMLKFGIDSHAYLFKNGPVPDLIDWKFHNPVVQVAMVVAQNIQGSTLGTDVWFLRHWLNFLMFFATAVILYRLARRLFDGWRLPLLTCAMFVLSPRVFAHGFYNPKDVPAMLLFAASMLTLLRLRERGSLGRLLVHAAVCALSVSLRSFDLIVVILTAWQLAAESGYDWKTKGRRVAGYLFAGYAFLLLCWPLLWSHPVSGLIGAIADNTSRSSEVLYMGALRADMPWHYVPVWIAITTPVLYTAFFLGGTARAFRGLAGMRRNDLEPSVLSLVALWFWLPVLAVMLLRVNLFNEWRHLLFVYPAFLLLVVHDIRRIMEKTASIPNAARYVVPGMLALQMGFTGVWMARNHPLEFGYFSVPASWVEGNFELDYWSLAYGPAFRHLLAEDARPVVNVYATERVAVGSALTLPLEDWQRLNFVAPSQADYILDGFVSNSYRHRFPDSAALHSVRVDGLDLLTIYKGPDTTGAYTE